MGQRDKNTKRETMIDQRKKHKKERHSDRPETKIKRDTKID